MAVSGMKRMCVCVCVCEGEEEGEKLCNTTAGNQFFNELMLCPFRDISMSCTAREMCHQRN